MTDSLPALLARLEAADAGSRELSDEALLATGRWARHGELWSVQLTPGIWTPWCHPAPDPTNSLDDARRWLVPEGWQWKVEQTPTDEGPCPGAQVNWRLKEYAATPELAFCAAALRAQAAQAAEKEG
jgi:hypothetical protein